MTRWLPVLRVAFAACLCGIALIIVLKNFGGPSADEKLRAVRRIAETITPELKVAKDDTRIALLLRNQVYRGVPSGEGPREIVNFSNWPKVYAESHLLRTRSNACRGKAILYMIALRAYGIPSRMVAMYASNRAESVVLSHASVDVLANGKWMAQDPTFNVSLHDNGGNNISWREAIGKFRHGQNVSTATDGMKTLPAYTVEAWKKNYKTEFEALAIYSLLGPWQGGSAENLTSGWDGKITYKDGSRANVWADIRGKPFSVIAAPGN